MRSLLKKNENGKLYAISVDKHEETKKLAEKIASDGKGKVNYPLLADPGHKTVDAYGIFNPAYIGKSYGDIPLEGIPYPAAYVIDKDGMVTWSAIESDYKKRSTSADIRVALDALKK
ncbi:MAG: hypothetical protein NVSMB56_20050 [Pyrinomonadaceae bacterium]